MIMNFINLMIARSTFIAEGEKRIGFYKLCSFFCNYAIPAMLVIAAIMPLKECYYAPNYAWLLW